MKTGLLDDGDLVGTAGPHRVLKPQQTRYWLRTQTQQSARVHVPQTLYKKHPSDTELVQEVSCWRSELTARSPMEHSYAPIGQASKEGGAQVFEAEDRASCRGHQDQQVLNGRVHAAVHVDAAKTGTTLGTEEHLSAVLQLEFQLLKVPYLGGLSNQVHVCPRTSLLSWMDWLC